MSTTYTADPANAAASVVAITNPSDGDAATATSNNVGQNLLADHVQRLRNMAATMSLNSHVEPVASGSLSASIVGLAVSANGVSVLSFHNLASPNTVKLSDNFGASWAAGITIPATVIFHDGYSDGTTWVIVGNGGVIWTSTDGRTWTARTSGVADNLNSVTKLGSTWVAVGDNGAIVTSTNATTWTVQTGALGSQNLNSVSSNGSVVVATRDVQVVSASNVLQYSSDGVTWTAVSLGSGYTYGTTGAMYAPTSSVFVAMAWSSSGSNTGGIWTSSNGSSWTLRATGLNHLNKAVDDGRCIAFVPDTNGARYLYSVDNGVNWFTTNTPGRTAGTLFPVASRYYGGILSAVSGGTPQIFRTLCGV